MKHTPLILSALALLLGVGPAHADSIFVDFSSYADGTPLSSVNGITLTLIGGPGPTGVPLTGFGGVTNSTTGAYPTTNILDFAFATPVSNLSFTFDNLGGGDPGQRGDSFFKAFDSNGILLETGSLNDASQTPFSLTSSGIRDTSCPLSQYSPPVGVSRQPIRFMSVDLPDPDGPMIATYSLRRISTDTPRSAWTVSAPIT